MSSNETYGGVSDIQATISGGAFGGGAVGRPITAVLVSRAASDAAAPPNTAVPINSRITSSGVSTVRAFGESSQLAEQLQHALANDAHPGLLYGVAPEEIAVTSETIPAGSGVLNHAPIEPYGSEIQVTDTDNTATNPEPTEVDVNFVYETLPTAPSGAESAVNLNPNTGEFEAPTDNDYEVSYTYLDYESAIDAAGNQVTAGDCAAIVVDATSEGVAETLQSKIIDIRPNWALALGGTFAEPNATGPNGEPVIDVESYSDALDYDGLTVFPGGTILPKSDPTTATGHVPLDASQPLRTLAGGLLGVMASNQLTDSIYHDVIEGYDDYRLTQRFSFDEIGDQQNPNTNTLRGQELSPIRSANADGTGELKILDDRTTSTRTDWLRTYHRRQVADNVLLNFRDLAQRVEDDAKFQTNSVLDEVKQSGLEILEELAADGVIMSSQSQQDTGDSTETQGIDVTGATPATNRGTAADTGAGAGGNGNQQEGEQFFGVEVTRTGVNALTIQFAYEPTPVTKQILLEGVVFDRIPSIQGATVAGTSANTAAVGATTGAL